MRVSVLIPTYNYAHYILEAIKSVEAQNYPLELIEVIIVDDGSTDNTKEIVKNHQSGLNIIYIYQENKGKALATQLGIENSSGDVIFNLDADDYFYPDKINSIVSIYKSHPEVVSVGHPADIIYHDTKEKETFPKELIDREIKGMATLEYFLEKRILFGGGSTFSAKASSLKSFTIFKGVDMYIDEYLIFSTYAQGNIYLLNKHLSVWRVHGNNYSLLSNSEIMKSKNKRLFSSSEFMLAYIKSNSHFSVKVKDLYTLKHLDRYFTSLEASKQKGLKEIMKLISIISSGKYPLKDLKNYRLFNRLIPTFIVKILKGIS